MATRKPAGKPSKKKSISVDFSDTETQAMLDEGDYTLEVDEVSQETSESSGADYLKFKFKVADGDFKGKTVYHNCSLQPQALFNLRGVLEALGHEVPQGEMDLDIDDLIGETCGAAIAHETYEGKKRPRPVEFFPADEVGNREEEPPAKGKKKAKEEEEVKPKKGSKAKEEEAPKSKKKVTKKTEPEFEEGDTVTFEDDDGDEQTGTITAVEDDKFTVTVGKGKKATEWELEADDLTKVED